VVLVWDLWFWIELRSSIEALAVAMGLWLWVCWHGFVVDEWITGGSVQCVVGGRADLGFRGCGDVGIRLGFLG
jgi:hypothetical protein